MIIALLLFFAVVSAGNALCDCQFGHTSWLRTHSFVGIDGWHWTKYLTHWYPPQVLILWLVWPLWPWTWYHAGLWAAAAVVGWLAWGIAARLSGKPWGFFAWLRKG